MESRIRLGEGSAVTSRDRAMVGQAPYMLNTGLTWTSNTGATSATQTATHKLGPYLSKLPVNPINGLNTVSVLADAAAIQSNPTGSYGWIYHPKSQTFLSDATGTGRDGVRYFDY